MNYINDKIKKTIKFLSNILDIFTHHLFLIFLLLLLLDSILIGYLFFKYSIQDNNNVSFQYYSIGLNQEVLDNVLEEWREREQLFEMVNPDKYLDLFRF